MGRYHGAALCIGRGARFGRYLCDVWGAVSGHRDSGNGLDLRDARRAVDGLQDGIDQANREKEVELKFDLERNVKLVSFNRGKIDISFSEKLNKDFIKNLTEKLLFWTGERWIISLSKNNNAKSVYEQNMEKKTSKIKEFEESDVAKKLASAFPDAKLIDIKEGENND